MLLKMLLKYYLKIKKIKLSSSIFLSFVDFIDSLKACFTLSNKAYQGTFAKEHFAF